MVNNHLVKDQQLVLQSVYKLMMMKVMKMLWLITDRTNRISQLLCFLSCHRLSSSCVFSTSCFPPSGLIWSYRWAWPAGSIRGVGQRRWQTFADSLPRSIAHRRDGWRSTTAEPLVHLPWRKTTFSQFLLVQSRGGVFWGWMPTQRAGLGLGLQWNRGLTLLFLLQVSTPWQRSSSSCCSALWLEDSSSGSGQLTLKHTVNI